MSGNRLDEVDRGVLHLLQRNARDMTPVDMAKYLPVSDGTVRNRIDQMEEDGIIDGYLPKLDYEAAGFPLQVVFSCTAPVHDQHELARDALDLHRVVSTRELLDSTENLDVVVVATDLDELVEVAAELVDLGLTIRKQRLIRNEYDRPCNNFGGGAVEDA